MQWSPRAVRSLPIVAAFSFVACVPEIGEPDGDAAREIVFRVEGEGNLNNGLPMTAGQALMWQTCGGENFCHTEGAVGGARSGAPHGLDFDMTLSCNSEGSCDCEEGDMTCIANQSLARLLESQVRVDDFKLDIWRTVQNGSMPPDNPGDAVTDADLFRDVQPGTIGTQLTDYVDPIPELDSAEGRDILRNWLAAGAPVVERTLELPSPSDRPGDYCGDRDVDFFAPIDCVLRAGAVIPPEPNWPSIYSTIVEPLCLQCHLDNNNDNWQADGDQFQELDLCGDPSVMDGDSARDLDCDADAVLMALVNQPAVAEGCEGDLIVPGNAADSIFLQKLRGNDNGGEPVCGRPMPQTASNAGLPQEILDPIEEFINNLTM